MSRHDQAAAIAGASLLIAFVVILPLAYVMSWFRVYGPVLREILIWCADPRTGIGLVLGMAVSCGAVFCIGMGVRR